MIPAADRGSRLRLQARAFLGSEPDVGDGPEGVYLHAPACCLETAHTAGDVGAHTLLALDESGSPHVGYYGNYDLEYAQWRSEAADSVHPSVTPGALRLLAIRPNPATSEGSILFSIGEGLSSTQGGISLRVYDALARLLAVPGRDRGPSGTHSVRWDLRSADGTRVSPGAYLLRLVVDGGVAHTTGKLVVVR